MLNSNNNVIDSLPAFSIVIPTRNGVRYLPFAIGSALNQDFHEFEIIISDNHSTDGTSDYLSGLTDDRCKIFRPESPLPMVKHFEFAISKAKGEWLVILGDDDGIQPYFFDLANKLINLDPSIEVISSARAYYIWPGCEPQYGDLVTSYNASRGLEVRKSIWCLKKLLFSDDDYFGAPLFYTGTIIKRSLVERILKNNSGQLFRTSIMDANSVSLVCRYVKSYIYSNIPLGWVGASPKSTGFAHVQSIAAQDKESEARVKDFDDLNSGAGLEVDRRFELIKFVNNFDLYFLEGFFAVFAKPGSIMAAVLWSFPVRHLLFFENLKEIQSRLLESVD